MRSTMSALRSLLLLCAATVACQAPPTPPSSGSASRLIGPGVLGPLPRPAQAHIRRQIAVDPPVAAREAEMATRWIGRVLAPLGSTVTCPLPQAGWDVDKLFRAVTPQGSLPPGLEAWCRYERLDPQAGIAPEVVNPASIDLEPDLASVAVLADLADVLSPSLARVTLENAGAPFDVLGATGPAVRLAFLDTTPTVPPAGLPWQVLGHNDHGYALLNLARRLTCDRTGDCLVDLSSRLTMDLVWGPGGEPVSDPVNGGDFGSIGAVAAAIREEVAAWEASGSQRGLVINLSLGWEAQYGGEGAPSTWPVAVQSVHAAIQDASCRGALVVAAAGNRTGGPEGQAGPIYPAGWETIALDGLSCVNRLGLGGLPSLVYDGKPLLYAAGGIDADGRPLANAREDNTPPQSAFGDHAVVVDDQGAYTIAKTGTSVSAAVVSSAAAALWQNQPGLLSFEVMDRVQNAGTVGDPISPAYCGGAPSCGDSREVRVCDTLAWTCDPSSPGYAPGAPCTHMPLGAIACPTPGSRPTPDPVALAAWEAAATTISPTTSYWSWFTHPSCDGGQERLHSTNHQFPPDPCPDLQYRNPSYEPFVLPQPHASDCLVCFIDLSSNKLHLERTLSWADSDSLTLKLRQGGVTSSLTPTTVPDTNLVEWILPAGFVTGLESASITSVIDDESMSSAIQLVP